MTMCQGARNMEGVPPNLDEERGHGNLVAYLVQGMHRLNAGCNRHMKMPGAIFIRF